MLSRNDNPYGFEFNFSVDSVFNKPSDSGSGSASVGKRFLFENGNDFLFENGDNFLLEG